MSERSTTKMISMGLLTVSTLALVVGIFNAAVSPMGQSEKAAEGKGSAITGIWGSSALKRDRLVQIDVTGPIMMEAAQDTPLFASDSMAVAARKALDKAAKDDSVKGVLLRIDSPGGTVGMSQELNAAVRRVSEKKPVVASLGDMTASGGYYTACAADKIVSNPGTLVGSIGVILSTLNLKGLLVDKLGLKALTIKSGKFKDILSPYRDTSPEEVALLQNLIDVSYKQFLNAVIEGRTRFIPENDTAKKKEIAEKIKSIADGRVLVATEAKKMGLVDEIGDIVYAKKVLNDLAKERAHIRGKEELPLEEYSEAPTLLEMLGITAAAPKAPLKAAAQPWSAVVPFSMQHPNQPLWILE